MIYSALAKYGSSKFSLKILEYCKPEQCLCRGQYYLQLLQPEYNILKRAGSLLGFKHSEKTLEKMKGRKPSEETRAKMSASKKGNTNSKNRSEETKAKI
jgi:group I intron endonuclease